MTLRELKRHFSRTGSEGQYRAKMEDFQKLISKVEATYKPQYDHCELTDKDLIVLYCIYTVWGHQCVTRILSRTRIIISLKETIRRVRQIANNPNPDNLAWLYTLNPDTRPLKFLVWLRLTEKNIVIELDKRHRSFVVGRAFIIMEEGKGEPHDIENLHKLMHVDKITSYRPAKEDAEDLRSEATMGASEFFGKRGETIVVKQRPGMPIPAIPAEWGLPPSDEPPLDQWHRYVLDRYIERLAEDYLSLFFGGHDRVKEKAWQALRDYWEKGEAKKRTGEEVDLQEAERILRNEGRIEDPSEELDREADISDRMFEVLKEAKKHTRWGDKAVKAFKYYIDGYSEEEASKRAGITERTFRNYISRLNKIFASRK